MARRIVAQRRVRELGTADASLVVFAQRRGIHGIATHGECAPRAVAPLQGGVFTVLPADS